MIMNFTIVQHQQEEPPSSSSTIDRLARSLLLMLPQLASYEGCVAKVREQQQENLLASTVFYFVLKVAHINMVLTIISS